jgi:hypothetical protein
MGDVLWQLYALVRDIELCACAGYCQAEKIVCLSKGKMALCIPGAHMMSPASAFDPVRRCEIGGELQCTCAGNVLKMLESGV